MVLPFFAGCRAEPIRNLGCDGPSAVEAGLRAAEGLRDRCAMDEACWESALGEARALRDRFPEELGAHRAYVLSRYRGSRGEYGPAGQAVAEEYRQLLSSRPDDPALLYLQALVTENRPARRELLGRSIASVGGSPWPSYTLALELGRRPEAEAKAEARQYGERFVAACPDRLPEIQRLTAALDDKALFDRYRDRFASAFRPEQGRFAELATLWQQSFQFAKPEEHAAVRDALVTEVATTAAEKRSGDRAWLRALEIGHRFTGDAAGTARVEDLILVQQPCEPQAISIRQRRFLQSQPKPERASATYDTWRREQLATVDALLESCPASGLARFWELNALAELDVVPTSRFIAGGLSLAQARDVHAHPSNPAAVAKRFLEQRVGIEHVAALLERDREEMEFAQARARMFAESAEEVRSFRVEEALRHAGRLALQIELALSEGREAESEQLLVKLAGAAERADGDASDEMQKRMVASTRADYWRLSAELAAARGDSAAALSAYGQAIASASPTEALRKTAASAFARFYGNDREFAGWIASAERARETALAQNAARMPEVAPDFRWPDLAGREWTHADLRGKTVLLNFWATWCGPCVAEMPYLTKLALRFRDDPRILIVGVNVDESPGPVQPFVQKLGCEYPILLGGAAAWTDWRLSAIPRNLVLSPSGEIASSEVAFGPDGDRWVERMAARLLDTAAREAPGKS